MSQLVFGVLILMATAAIAALGSFYGTQLAREGWTAWRDSKKPKLERSVQVMGNVGNTQAAVESGLTKQGINDPSAQAAIDDASISMQPKDEPSPRPTASVGGVNVSNNKGNTQVAINSPGAQQTINVHAPLQRRLSGHQRQKLVDALRQFSGIEIDVVAPIGDGESARFALEFISVFREAGINCGPNDGLNQAEWSIPPKGIEVSMNDGEVRAGRVPPVAQALVAALKETDLIPELRAFVNPQIQAGKVELRVGSP